MTTLQLRYMRPSDIPGVVAIDRQSFSISWSARSYAFEVARSPHSHMLVLERIAAVPPSNAVHALWQQVTGLEQKAYTLLGYGGLWQYSGETHISTIASHPHYRGQGWGELLLLAMLRRSLTLNMRRVVLEVRLSNTPARKLYEKYGFVVRGIKPGYYSDNKEDAYDMALALSDAGCTAYIEQRYAAYQAVHHLEDGYTVGQRPEVHP